VDEPGGPVLVEPDRDHPEVGAGADRQGVNDGVQGVVGQFGHDAARALGVRISGRIRTTGMSSMGGSADQSQSTGAVIAGEHGWE
jgi:hypothetical protein